MSDDYNAAGAKELPIKIVSLNEDKKENFYQRLIVKADEILEKISKKDLKQKVS